MTKRKPTEWMPLHIDAFKAKTSHCSFMERWAYMALLTCYWRTQKPLPSSDTRLQRMTELTSSEWTDVQEVVLEFFEEKDGLLHQPRMDAEIEKARWLMEKRVAAGQKGGISSGKARSKKEASASVLVKQNASKHPSKTNTCGLRQNAESEGRAVQVTPPVIPENDADVEASIANIERKARLSIAGKEAARLVGRSEKLGGVS